MHPSSWAKIVTEVSGSGMNTTTTINIFERNSARILFIPVAMYFHLFNNYWHFVVTHSCREDGSIR